MTVPIQTWSTVHHRMELAMKTSTQCLQCILLRYSAATHNMDLNYKDMPLPVKDSHKDLRVGISPDPSWSQHHRAITAKAYQIVTEMYIRQNVIKKNSESTLSSSDRVKADLPLTSVEAMVNKEIIMLEKVQRKVTKFIWLMEERDRMGAQNKLPLMMGYEIADSSSKNRRIPQRELTLTSPFQSPPTHQIVILCQGTLDLELTTPVISTSVDFPQCGTHSPDCGTHSPDCGTHSSDCGTHSPDCGTHSPDCGTHSPDCGTHSSDCGTHSPDCGTHSPDCGTHSSDCGTHSPDCGMHTQTVEFTPQTVELTPQTVELTPQTVELTPQTVVLTPQTVELTPQTVELTSQTVELTPQTVELLHRQWNSLPRLWNSLPRQWNSLPR